MAYPVSFDVQPPQTFDKAQVVLRILLFLVLSWFLNGILGAAYWLLPIIAAIMIAQKGAATYLAEAEKGPTMWLRYIMGAYSYLALASDKLPFEHPEEVDLKVQPSGTPSVGSALLRIILAIPHAIVLGVLGFIFFFIWIISAVSILINETVPDWAESYIRGYLRWTARVLAYLASLVDEYPPFSFDNGEAAPAALPPTQPSGGEAPGSEAT